MTVSASQRFTRSRPCPVCEGHEQAPRGQGVRCYGFLGGDEGEWAHCTSEAHAARLPLNSNSDTYAHRLVGECDCGARHDPNPPSRNGAQQEARIVATYDYNDEEGRLLYQEVRYEPKSFKVRRPDGKGGWIWRLGSVRRVLYNLPDLAKAELGETAYVPEGPKDVDRLAAEGVLATTNALGAKKWLDEYSESLRGRNVVILPDNDDDGRTHAEQVARSLLGKARTIKVLELPGLPERGDVSDWLDAGHTVEELKQLAERASPWEPWARDGEPVVKPLVSMAAQSAEEFLAEEIPEPDAYVGDGGDGAILSPGEKLMVAGPPGVGKTNICYNMAASLAAGNPVLGLTCRRPCRVLYALLEGNRKLQQKRLRKVLLNAEPETLGRFYFSRIDGLDLSQEEHVLALEELCRSLKIDVLFIDPFREAHPWGEDKSEDAARIMRVLNGLLAVLPGLAIVLIHHVRKPDPRRLTRAEQTLDQIRGSGHLVASCQSVLLVNEDPNEPDKLLADWVKHRDAEQRLAPMFLYFDRATLSYEVAERPGTVKVTPEAVAVALTDLGGHALGQGDLLERIKEATGAGERTAQESIREAVRLKVIIEEPAPTGSGKRKAYSLPSISATQGCDHWPSSEVQDLWDKASQSGADSAVCTCCGGPFSPPLTDDACDVCRAGDSHKVNTALRIAVGRGARKLDGGYVRSAGPSNLRYP